jgi:hypothetical protein
MSFRVLNFDLILELSGTHCLHSLRDCRTSLSLAKSGTVWLERAKIGEEPLSVLTFFTASASVAHLSQFGSDSDPACEHRFGFGFKSNLNKIYYQFTFAY